MIASWKALLVAGITLALIALISLAGFIYSYGLTARGRPGVFETYAAHAIRSLALLRKKKTPVPIPVTDEGVGAGATQFTAMCSSCHGEYGRGMKVITTHLYPPVPELQREETQRLGDPALFAIIRDGIPFTGMPASDLKDVEIAQVVAFLRGLPKLSDADIDRLKRERAADSAAEHQTGQR